jgi:hypothetical protein
MDQLQVMETLELQRFLVAGIGVTVFVIALVAGIMLVTFFKIKS